MKNPWSARDSERLAWKAIDLAVDAVLSLTWVRDLMAIDIFSETPPAQVKALKPRPRRRKHS
jgi:hypothetical protein